MSELNKIRTLSKDHALVLRQRESVSRHAVTIFAKKGYKSTNVGEIAQACGMSKGNIYNYVGTKSDILSLALDLSYAPTLELCANIDRISHNVSVTEALRQAMNLLFQWADATQSMIQFVYHETRNLASDKRKIAFEMDEKIIEQFEGILNRGCQVGEFSIDDVTMVAYEIVVLAEMWAVKRWFLKKRYTLDEYARKGTELVLRTIKNSSLPPRRPNRSGKTGARNLRS